MGGSPSSIAPVDLSGKVAIVTGANTGIGLITARELARFKAQVFVACRSMEKGKQTIENIKKQIGEDAKLDYLVLDLGSMKSVREAANSFRERGLPLHLLINNAGIMNTPYGKTVDGIEQQWGVNHIGHFLFTLLLIDIIKASAPARIVNLSSAGHVLGKFDWNDINLEKSYGSWTAYGRSKLSNILFTVELAKKLQGTGVTVNAVHPGFVETELTRHSSMKSLIDVVAKVTAKSPEQGAYTTLVVACDPQLENVTGKYFADGKEKKSNDLSRDENTAKKLWEVSLQISGLQEVDPLKVVIKDTGVPFSFSKQEKSN